MGQRSLSVLLIHRWVGSRDGGAETHIDLIVEALLKSGHQVDVVTRDGSRVDRFPLGVRVHTVKPNPAESDHSYIDWRVYPHTLLFMVKVFFLVLIRLRLAGRRFDVVSTHFATEAMVAWVLKALTRVPYVHVLEGYTPLEARWAKRAASAIAISEHDARRCEQAHGFRPEVINIGLPESTLAEMRRTDSTRQDEEPVIALMVARFDYRKGVDVLVRAMREVVDAGARVRAIVAGKGIERPNLETLIKNLDLEEHVQLVGPVDLDELRCLYGRASMFVLPTRYEGFGIVLIEAMAAGLPIVSTTVGAVPDVVGDAGRLVPPENPHAFAEAILSLYRDSEAAISLGVKGMVRVNDRYRWSELGSRYVATYERAASPMQ